MAVEKRAAYSHETYWGRPVPGFGDPDARVVVMGLAPAAHGAEHKFGGITLLGCYHVSQQNTFTGRLTPDMLDNVLLRAKEIASGGS